MNNDNMTAVQQLPVSEIDYAKHSIIARFETEPPESEELESLTNTIKKSGVLEPIIVRPKGAKRYEVVAGNRRLRASKAAHLTEIPAIVKDLTDEQALRIAYIENVHRKDLNTIQKAKGIAAIYKTVGIESELAIQLVKHLHNTKISEFSLQLPRIVGKNLSVETSKNFIEACREIGYSANIQYQLLQLITKLPEPVIEVIKEEALPQNKATLLTHSRLQEYPEVQEMLAKKIKDMSVNAARQEVNQTIHDLETGYKWRDSTTGQVLRGTGNRDIIEKNPEIESEFLLDHLDLRIKMKKLIGQLLGRSIARGEIEYTPDVYEPKIKELKKKMASLPKRERGLMAVDAGILMLVCRAIVDSARQ